MDALGHRLPKLALVLFLLLLSICAAPARAQWPQFGGPSRNFVVETEGLADEWTDQGPAKLWHRELGDGYSSIVVDGGILYTMYRKTPTNEHEYTIALQARTGKTLWEHRTEAPLPVAKQYATGPNSTPLCLGNHVYTINTNQVLGCFDKRTGNVVWKRNLADDFGSLLFTYGYGSSPLAYDGKIILSVGGRDSDGTKLVAYNAASGELTWRTETIPRTKNTRCEYSAPLLINFGGEDQLVYVSNEKIIGLNPNDGKRLWDHPHVTQGGRNLSTPVWDGTDTVFCSTAYDSGSRVIRLSRKDNRTVPEQLWFHRRMRLMHGNGIIIEDMVLGSSGDTGPTFLLATDLETGKILWRERGFKKASVLYADGKLIILDEDGQLGLGQATREGLTILSRAKVAETRAWTPPTLVGKMLYVRDQKHIMALDLG
ncbi:MAG: PQQ-binding-like beta-propeller repeat protein [bacterium]|nr:PQQ-binding-like beta-propeller repeat protein [bacterium]